MQPHVELKNISKSFSGVQALKDVSLSAFKGEVLALVGENGAGKSTVMNILSGVYPYGSYDGSIFLNSKEIKIKSPDDAYKYGITIIHQELSAFQNLTVAENMCVGQWPKKNHLVSWSQMYDYAKKWLGEINAQINPKALMSELSAGEQQLVEVAKALSKQSEVIIFDEPTSSLTPRESKKLFELINQLKINKKTLIYISHKMDEIFNLSNRICVLRDGKSVFETLTNKTTEAELISAMVGRPQSEKNKSSKKISVASNNIALEVKALKIKSKNKTIGPFDLKVKQGQILGIAGLLGAGRTELIQAIYGHTSSDFVCSGDVYVNGKNYNNRSPRESLKRGIAFVGEDRKRDSILPERTIKENTSISKLILNAVTNFLNLKTENEQVYNALESIKTKYSSQLQVIRELSGGNQQKVILSRVLQTEPNIIILDEPTRGVDVGAKAEIYNLLLDLSNKGKTLIIVSSELPELISLSAEVIVISKGKIKGHLMQSELNQEAIMQKAIL